MKRVLFNFLLTTLMLTTVSDIAGVEGTQRERQRAAIHDRVVLMKLDTVLGPAMRTNDIQMWVILTREFNVDPVLPFISPDETYAGVGNAYVFIDTGRKRPERILIGSHLFKQRPDFYDRVIPASRTTVGQELRKLVEQYRPRRIGINMAQETSAADGLTASFKELLMKELGPKWTSHLVSAERLVIDYLDARLPEEEALFREAAEVTKKIWEEALSNKLIQPRKTTVGDVLWYLRQRCADHGVGIWFRPGLRVQRRGLKFAIDGREPDNFVLERGDVLHLDFGISYLDFSTDYQKHAYILRDGETEVPAGLQQALENTNRLQDFLFAEMRPGRTGQEVYTSAMERARTAELEAMIYSHSIGNYGHFVGAAIGSFKGADMDMLRVSLPLRLGSYTSIELNTKTPLPEWDGQEVYIMMEDDAVLSPQGMKFFIPRQTRWYVIR